MSAWERSRSLPWDRVPLPDLRPRGPGEDPPPSVDAAKERIVRQLQHEAAAEDEKRRLSSFQQQQQQQQQSSVTTTTDVIAVETSGTTTTTTTGTTTTSPTKVPYSHMDLLRQAAFGGCIGSITGSVFGFMDGMRTAGESSVLQKASNMAKGKYLMQGTTRSATIFGVFFGGFHIVKYGVRVILDPGEFAEIAVATPIAMGALMARPHTRHAMPYGAMLVFMDSVNLYMRKSS